ncbi:hypothetical protein [Streptomyces sp. NPDC101776]|uniref:hypothetical protein n=1 Tax=Streptomyces sp. NPDC101776 TaxID=3366146 RepID=UPI00381F7366
MVKPGELALCNLTGHQDSERIDAITDLCTSGPGVQTCDRNLDVFVSTDPATGPRNRGEPLGDEGMDLHSAERITQVAGDLESNLAEPFEGFGEAVGDLAASGQAAGAGGTEQGDAGAGRGGDGGTQTGDESRRSLGQLGSVDAFGREGVEGGLSAFGTACGTKRGTLRSCLHSTWNSPKMKWRGCASGRR